MVEVQTAPCSPRIVSAYLECTTHTVSVLWELSDGAMNYIAIAEGMEGDRYSCNATEENCEIVDLPCGQMYNITILAMDENCSSLPSPAFEIQTVPCIPQNVIAYMDCESNNMSVFWDPSNGTESYLVTAQGNSGHWTSCNATDTECVISDVYCGLSYYITVQAIRMQCNSSQSSAVTVKTVPCVPQNVDALMNCDAGYMSVSWELSQGAISYIATAEGSNVQQCSANETLCDITELDCGETYTITVRAHDDSCDTAESASITKKTVPCPPQNIQVDIDAVTAFVTWEPSNLTVLYTATAEGSDGHEATCTTSETHCLIPDLHCSQIYSISVLAFGANCSSIQGSSYDIRTAPCSPNEIIVNVNCNSDRVIILWERTHGAVSYYITAEGSDGHAQSYNTAETHYEVLDLHCGQTYNITITTHSYSRTGISSTSVQTRTAPCIPENLKAELNCDSNAVSFSWDVTDGAKLYTVTARDSQRVTASFKTSDTKAQIPHLECGEYYTISVVATDNFCKSPQSAMVNVHAVPCDPQNVEVRLDCNLNTALVSWDDSRGALLYTAFAEGPDGNITSCSTSETSCRTPELLCGQLYSVYVTASDSTCNQSQSSMVEIQTAPCSPRIVSAYLECTTHTVSVLWELSDGAVNYIAIAEGMEGDRYSCNATEENCEIVDLPCGQMYNITILAMDGNCSSLPSPAFEIQTVPCIPQNVIAYIDCESNNVSVFWDPSNGTESYLVTAQGNSGHWASCNATDTECVISDVYCGLSYYITVQAIRMQCNSSQSSAVTVKTVPCVPQNVDALMNCDAGYMSVSWELSQGAISYIATAEGSNVQQCSANETLCDITELHCGETYTITVRAHDDSCDTAESASITKKTASCIPQNLGVQLDCNTNDAAVSWTHTNGAMSYSASAEGSDGHAVSCDTVNTQCQIANLHCGQMYNLTLTALDNICDTSQSSIFDFSTAPCAPQFTDTSLNCVTKSTTVTWEESDGALWYITTAEGQDGHVTLCNSTETSCEFTDLHCSQTYLITVKAIDGHCQSVNTSTFETETVPCSPQNVHVDVDTVTAFVTWEPSNLTVSYTATAEGCDGHTAACTTSETHCLIPDLHCSQIYSISVLAFGTNCSSIQSSSYDIWTAPCTPDDIKVTVDCNSNRAVASWERTDGAILYELTAEGSDGHTHSYSTTETRYEMMDLHCGQTYNITVTTRSYSRTGFSSTSAQTRTAPCIPENPKAELNCDSNAVSFSWDVTDGAKLYTVTARDSQRVTASFNTSDTKAQIPHLECGEYYTISVVATDNICKSAQSAVVNVHAVPCDPQNVEVRLDCNLNTASVSWDDSRGALLYTAFAEGPDGNITLCSTSETSCRTPELLCGQLYSVYVTASDSTCNQSESSMVEVQTAPCSPRIVSAYLECTTHTVSVLWELSDGAMNYIAIAEGMEGDRYSCNATEENCEIVDLPCGQMYNITILAMDGNCSSLPSPAFEIQTVPCIPQNVIAYMDCESNNVSVFWDPSNGTESYLVTAQGNSGHWASCNATDTECVISDVYCGLSYYITVQAIRMQCNSSQSSAVTVKTVPCVPQNVDALMNCDAGYMSVSWELSQGAISYIATAEGSNVQQCSANETLCDITELHCGETYTITVRAHDDSCDTAESASITKKTASCIPQNLGVQLDCNTNDAAVSWTHTNGAMSYSASAEGSDGHAVSCDTVNTQCQIANLHCGQMYNLTLTALDNVCDTSQSSISDFSTAPCAPQFTDTSLNCVTKSTTVTWEESDGALWYITTAEGQDGHVTLCNSTETSCEFTDLHCSQTYLITVKAMDGHCQNVNTSTFETETVPCPPQNVQADIDAVTAFVTWEPSNLTVSYTATAEGSDGHEATCTTSETHCLIPDLHCSQIYSISVLAFGANCSSIQGSSYDIWTVPCAPDEIIVNVVCNSNRVVASWGRTDGAILYDVTAEGSDGHTHSHNTTETRHEMLDLHCGQTYNITVTTLSYSRTGFSSTSAQIQTAPCIPENLKAELNCDSNAVSFSWDVTDGAKLYTVTARDSQRVTASFNTSDTKAQIPHLECGEYYTISVVATDNICKSAQSAVVNIHAVPCDPQNVEVRLDCNLNTALVSWDDSRGALLYTAFAEGPDGNITSCSTSETSCRTPKLLCGQLYSVYVTASDSTCNQSQSSMVEIQTAPCSPRIVSAYLECTTHTVSVLWELSDGAMNYIAIAEGMEGDRYSCNATEENCEIVDLPCGQMYNITILAMDGNCSSLPSPAFEIQTVPCIPQNVVAHIDCESNNVSVFWDPSNGTESYLVTAQGNSGHWASCNATDTECVISDVYCGLSYYITVQAIRMQCNSSQSSAVTVKTVPCVPQNVDALMNCDAGYMSVSWELSQGAISYIATAEGSNVQQCSANETLCDITELDCGETYTITVRAHDDSCDTAESASVTKKTASCIPQNLGVQLDCNTNDAAVSWTHTNGAMSYSASAEGSDGHAVSCDTVNTQCQIANLHCGQMYNLTLTALDNVCDTSQSSISDFSTAPCAPQFTDTSLNCVTKSTTVTWEESDGALWYITTAEGQDGHVTLCNSTETSCEFTDLHCSQTYLITVKAMDGHCQSVNTSTFETETVPCPPQNIQADIDTVTAFVTWEPSNLTVSYTATAEGCDGHTAACTTSETHCLIPDLHCSQIYSISVLAFGANCSSIQGSSYDIWTAPCAPDEIIVNVDCNSNRVVASWERTDGAILYDVTAEGSDGHTHSHNTTETRHEMLDLHCGQTYNITVTTLSYSRTGFSSTSTQIQTAPCIPENLKAELNCDSNAVSFSWDVTDGAKLYTVTARDSQRVTASFNTSDTKAQIPHLECGEYYTISVVATDNICKSAQSAMVNIHAVPCDPQNVQVRLDCNLNTALVSWDDSRGALLYTAFAEGPDGDITSCSTSETSCRTPELLCGQLYSVYVTASDSTCNQSQSSMVEVQTAPCSPRIVSAYLECTTHTVSVLWELSDGAVNYIAIAEGMEGDRYSCNATEENCEIVDLPCGQMYNITIFAMDENCSSLPSPAFEIQAVPCIPQNVVAHMDCESNNVSVFWDPSNGTESYLVTAQGNSGHWASCNATDTECVISDVYCGLSYYITVQAIRMQCNSSQSSAVTVKTVPCVPQNVDALMNCDAGYMSVSWELSQGAISYIATAEGSNVQQCSANETLCDITELHCGETYTITVRAHDDSCDTAESASITKKTASCIPQNLGVQLDCNTNDAAVSWTHTNGAMSYSASAEGSDGHAVSCDTVNTQCQISNLHCGQMYNLTLTALDNVCDTSQSSISDFSTAPCAPQFTDTSLNCVTKSTTVTWEESDGALWYIATGEGQDGHVTLCNTTETSCEFTDLHCSQTYLITVKAMDGHCQSVNTSTFETETVPCPPQNIQADIDTVTAFVTWEPSNLTVSYTATAEGSDGHTAACTTSETHCLIPDLHCSQIYSISVLASGANCSSIQGSSYDSRTAPCAPDEIIVNVDCNSNRVVASWGRTDGAILYDVTAEGSDGHTHSHNTTETRHEMLDLHCGQTYNITVTTLSYSRNGFSSTSAQIQTAPCIPENLKAELNCDSNAVSFSWDVTDGAKLYTVTIRDSQRVTASFNTSDTKAQIPHLECGEYYTISVVATDNICKSPQSAVVNVHAGPCTSEIIAAYVDCDSNTAMVSWEPSNGSDFYIATAMGIDGDMQSCIVKDITCEIFHLKCGQSYNVTLVAVNEMCNSSESAANSFQGVPCTPEYLEADVDCANNSLLLSWGHSNTAISYMAFVNVSDGDLLHCDTTNTSCYIQGLKCATKYDISVYAFDGICTSILNASSEVDTVPCVPGDIQVALSPASNGVQGIDISWGSSNCAEDYEVNIDGQIEDDPFSLYTLRSYWTPSTFFEFPVLCSSTYNISVTARNPAGTSSPSIPLAGLTVPCSPNNLMASLENGTLFISWTESFFATEYVVYAVSNSERSEICRTAELSCEAPNIPKDMIEIVALNSAGESETSKINLLQDSSTPPKVLY
ncbi:uncharacterized protein LOC119964794 [Scyliorhinus canicula]|uniref:uncharacterized protein LOC119964794 n=1 Tax=Scyliorhinus canicula TaxID=7830 RepID=UPI0018F4F427|nr:uncharacterized protein LOC119964794 [Scyliorhinus canicula]